MPKRVLFTPAALAEAWGRQIYDRVSALGLPIEELRSNRLVGLRGANQRETYNLAKRTLAVVTAPPSAFKLQPTPPSADWQLNLAEGCPAHCQYCYLAGSLQGPPVVRVFANLPSLLDNLSRYERPGGTTFEASCYTDPLSLEHLTGSLSECIRHFGSRAANLSSTALRWVTKFDAVDGLLDLPHHGRTRCRVSVNAAPITGRMEGGTASTSSRLQALRKLAAPRSHGGGNYPVGLVIAPIMPIDDWRTHYRQLLEEAQQALDFPCDLSFELITHRFTPASKDVLREWYPKSGLDMNEATRRVKQNRFGSTKYVYRHETMADLRAFFEREIAVRFPRASLQYWT